MRSLDDMAERELAKQSKSSKSKQYTQKEFDELTKLMPDPATQQDSLLADGTLYGCVCLNPSGLLLLRVKSGALTDVTSGPPLQLWKRTCGGCPALLPFLLRLVRCGLCAYRRVISCRGSSG